jgi:4-amino-4-deoxy-L-arabinose transferase-like glycosyltransferase
MLRSLYLLLGPSEWAMRLPAAVASAAAVVLMIPLARRLVDGWGWMWAVALCAVSRHAVTHAYEAKPYALDFFITQLILLAAVYLLTASTQRRRLWGGAGLLAGALVAPWMSFPSVLVLGGASLAVALVAVRGRSRSLAAFWLVWNSLLAFSLVFLWWSAVRFQNSQALQEYWRPHFTDFSSAWSALFWTLQHGIAVGDYATTGMGLPLGVLAIVGAFVLGRRRPECAVLLAGPLALLWVAAALRSYPAVDRLLFFAAPCLWLLAAQGAVAIGERLRFHGRFAWVGPALLAIPLAPGFVQRVKDLGPVSPKAEFRQAFEYIQSNGRPGDSLWMEYPEVHEVYFGKDAAVLGPLDQPEDVRKAAQTGRLWMIFSPVAPATFPEVFEEIQTAPCLLSDRANVVGLNILLYEPANSGH